MEKKEQLDLILLNVARKLHHADWNWKGVYSPFARIYMVESGSAKVIMPDGEHIIRPGSLYMVPAFVTHSYVNDSTFILYYIHIYDEHNIFDRLNFPFEVEAQETDEALVRRLLAINPGRELVRSDPEAYDNLPTLIQTISRNEQLYFCTLVETRGILLQLFSRFLELATFKQSAIDNRILKVIRHVRENIYRNITVHELATLSNLTKDHFIRLFKRELDCTPLQYINQKKIERAQLMLVVSSKSIKDVAHALAFDNLSYFYRLFRKLTGTPPQKYKRNREEM
jgi:AraC-like DNA-binding protein/mannose-6-phosphate isomerase-like protein (cupin superfamily)